MEGEKGVVEGLVVVVVLGGAGREINWTSEHRIDSL